MSRLFYHTCQDNAGNLLFDVTGTMRLAGSGTLATIYGDEALTVILPNPMTCHPSFASFKCFLGAGDYDFYLAKSGYTFETLTGVQGHGSMAQQDASDVVLTGGIATLEQVGVGTPAVDPWALLVNGPSWMQDTLAVGEGVSVGSFIFATQNMRCEGMAVQGSAAGMRFQNVGVAAGDGYSNPIAFGLSTGPAVLVRVDATQLGTMNITPPCDVRLKEQVEPLTGALARVQAMRPVSYIRTATGQREAGFLAHEMQQVVQDAVHGAAGAVTPAGQIVPQGMDQSKLIVWLVSACQDLAQQVQALTAYLDAAGLTIDGLMARVHALETARM